MSFKIDIGLEEDNVDVIDTNIDLVAAAEAMSHAERALMACETEQAIVVAAAENLDRGIQLANAIAEKTRDEGVALAVGKEALTASLNMLGQAEAASQITAGTESFTAGTEAAEGMLKKLLDKAQEYGKKIWDFITNLAAKVVKFVKGIFGISDARVKLTKLIDKAKDEGRTTLKVTEFDKEVATKLGKKLNFMRILAMGKAIGADEIIDFNRLFIKASVDSALMPSPSTQLDILLNFSKDIFNYIKEDDITSAKNYLDSYLVGFINLNKFTDFNSNMLIYDITAYKLEPLLTPFILKEFNIKSGIVKTMFTDANNIELILIHIDKESEAFKKYYSSDITLSDMVNFINEIKIDIANLSLYADKYGFAETKITPVTFDNAKKIINAMKEHKPAMNRLSGYLEKNIKDVGKDSEKAFKKIAMQYAGEADDDDIKQGLLLMKALFTMTTKVTSNLTQGIIKYLKETVNPKWADVIEESIKLYEK